MAALCAIASAGLALADSRLWKLGSNVLVEHPLVWRAFRPVVRFAGQDDSERALNYLRRGSAILRAAEADLQLEPATATFRDHALESLEDFDFAQLYDLLPERRGPYRRWSFEGEPVGEAYRVRPLSNDRSEVNPASSRRTLGQSSGVLRMRPSGQGRPGYLLHFRGGVGFGDITWPSVLAGLKDMLGVVHQAWNDETITIIQAAEAHLAKAQPTLGPEDRRVLAQMWASFPAIAEHMVRLGSIDDVLAPSPISGCSRVQLRSRYHPQRLAEGYPALTDYLEGLGDLSTMHTRLLDGDGHLLAETWVDSETLTVRVEAFVKGGTLVPSERGRPLPHLAANFSHMRAVTDARIVLRGVEVSLRDVRVDLSLHESSEAVSLQASLTTMPDIEVSGAAFGFIPTGMVDWFIPGDLQGLTEGFLRAMVEGNDGRGLAAFLRFARPEGSGGATVDGSAGVQVLESPLIRFALSVLSEHYVPDPDESEDMRRLALAYRDAFDADVNRFARFGMPVVSQAWRERAVDQAAR